MQSEETRKLVAGMKRSASNHLGMHQDQLIRMFPIESKPFWQSFNSLARKHRRIDIILPPLQRAQARRQAGGVGGRGKGPPKNVLWIQDDVAQARFALENELAAQPSFGNGSAADITSDSKTPTPSSVSESASCGTPTTHVIWCGIPTCVDIGAQDQGHFLKLGVDSETAKSNPPPHALSCFSETVLERLEVTLGTAFVSISPQKERIIHQDLATILFAEQTGLISVEHHPWDWMLENMSTGRLKDHIRQISASKIVIYVAYIGGEWTKVKLAQFYEGIGLFEDLFRNLRVYPRREEWRSVTRKLAEVSELDAIAETSKAAWSFRPKLCHGFGVCDLQSQPDELSVRKRTVSDGANHVFFIKGSERDCLACYLNDNDEVSSNNRENVPVQAAIRSKKGLNSTKRGRPKREPEGGDADEPGARYFHMEYIPSLREFGEFRVFICDGSVVATAHTSFTPDRSMLARAAVKDDFSRISGYTTPAEEKKQELHAFALHQVTRLRQLDSLAFDSLSIGVRLDIGVSEQSPQGRFFCLEVTRFWNAVYFPLRILPDPYIDISHEFGQALAKGLSR
ncbi:hypothetical protein FDECE_11534 [Fusarium decemcellulare]|nr:hypothetical protein FDECE_11534 [Fusarium decemcellulare]